ncbi:hypothetical protein [Klebsiella aerogenes]|uniref:hypothetical protein n=1 Tax=Klebsiella aerogenes TaxID=548 RepID=UPI0025515928|nr:hypothetical protein [Klebsiella aerogenes]MDK7098763.1 hypothetical protein [Klebsiella aerogenes]MDK7643932.1 hypothetical protein [Klebsiella aerogenes]MDK7848759.1 hypothetical protein [Klebsiella aerogenes]MDK8311088.1 hypothetical protein [Klebsiella aerogenes]
MTKGTQQSSLDNVSKNTVVNGEHGPQVYFHPGSATLLCVDAKDNRLLIQEQLKMTALLENQKKAQIALDELNFEMLTQAGKKPQRAYDSKLQNAYQQLNDANEKLKAELKTLTAKVPEGELLDENSKESAIGLMELIPLQKTAGFKSTYVRSDKIRGHWRKYKLSEIDKKSGEASFIKYETKEVTGIDADGNETKKTVRSGKIDTEELIKQLKEASASLKFEDELLEDSNVVLTDWAKKMNKGLTWPKENDKPDDESTYHQYVDISAQAQLMRYSQGAGLSAEFNPLEKKATAKMEGHSSFALGEAKASTELFIPDRLGMALLFPAKASAGLAGDVCNMGAIRYTINAVLSGNVGASLGIELGVEADFSGEMAKGYGIKGSPAKLAPPPPPGQRKINLTTPLPDVQAGGEIGAFAGVQAGGNISGALEWFDPHPDDDKQIAHDSNKKIVAKEKKFTAIAKLSLGVTAQAGAGGSAVFYVTYISSRFRIYCKAALCWGGGAKGALGFEVDGNSFSAFMKSFMYMLRNVDYQKLEQMMEGDAFRSLCAIPIIMAAQGIEAGDAMLKNMFAITQRIRTDLDDENKRVDLMNSILSNPDQLKYTPPETKGAIIATLIDSNWADWVDPRNQNNDFFSVNSWKIGPLKRRKQAVFKALKWVQSQADYNNVMQHLTTLPGERKGDKNLNEQDVIKFLGIGEKSLFFYTHYGEKLALLYGNLRTSVDHDDPFVHIPDHQMDEYLAMVDEQHPASALMKNTMMA